MSPGVGHPGRKRCRGRGGPTLGGPTVRQWDSPCPPEALGGTWVVTVRMGTGTCTPLYSPGDTERSLVGPTVDARCDGRDVPNKNGR